MKQLSYLPLLAAPITKGATTHNPSSPTIVWSTISSEPLVWNGVFWDTLVQDADLKSIENLNSYGFLVRDANTGQVVTRSILGTAGQISISSPDGNQGNAVASLVNTGVIPGVYTKLTVGADGRIQSAGNLQASDIPADYIKLYDENYTDAAPNTVLGANAVALGNGNAALTAGSVVVGEQGKARHINAFIHSTGRFSAQGDSQVGRYILRAVTTNNFTKQMFLDGPAGITPLILPDNSTWTFRAMVTAHRTDADDGHAGFEIRGVVSRAAGAGTVQFQGRPIVDTLGASNTAWTINTEADAVGGSLNIIVQGENSKIIRWVAHIETVEITN